MRLGPAFTGETCEKCRLEQFAEKFGNVSFRTSAVFAGARNLLCFQSKRISHLVLDDSFSMCSASCGPLAELFPGRTVHQLSAKSTNSLEALALTPVSPWFSRSFSTELLKSFHVCNAALTDLARRVPPQTFDATSCR